MSILTKGDQLIFANDPKESDLLFTKFNPANGRNEDSTFDQADTMRLNGYATVGLSELVDKISVERPQPAKKDKYTIDSADPLQFDLASDATGKVIRFVIGTRILHLADIEFYTAGWDGFRKHAFYAIKVRSSDTAATILQRLADNINNTVSVEHGEYPFKASFAAGVFSLETKNPNYLLRFEAQERVDVASTALDVFAPVHAVEQFEGIGGYDNLHTYTLQTDATNEAYSIQQYGRVQKGRFYTGLQFFTRTERPDLSSNELADSYSASKNTFTLQVANGNEAFLAKVLGFLNRAGAGVAKVYTGTDAAAKTLTAVLADQATA